MLAQNLLDTYSNAGGACDAARSAAVLQIFAAFPTASGKADDLTKAVDFMRAAIR